MTKQLRISEGQETVGDTAKAEVLALDQTVLHVLVERSQETQVSLLPRLLLSVRHSALCAHCHLHDQQRTSHLLENG